MLTRPICHLKDISNWGACDIRMRCDSPSYTVYLKFRVSADYNTDMIHLAIFLGDTGLYGLMKDKNNLETKCPLRTLSASEREIYSFNAASGQTETQPVDEKVILIDFPCLEVFDRSVTSKLIESWDPFWILGLKQLMSAVSVQRLMHRAWQS